jgi:hypothetical protein
MKTPAAIMYNILGEDEVDMIPYSYVHVSSHFGLYLGRSPCSYL